MAERSRGMLFRKRNLLGAVLIAGIGLGIYLGKWTGFGNGGNGFFGFGGPGDVSQNETADDTKDSPAKESPELAISDLPQEVPRVVRVLINEHDFLLRSEGKDTPISLKKLVELIQQAPGDDDGIRVRVYEKMTARAKAEDDLKEALTAAGIPDTAVFWVPPNPEK